MNVLNELITTARTTEEAIRAQGEYRAGGTDVGARRQLGISDGPMVDIRWLEGCQEIEIGDDGAAAIGAMVTLHL